jgi:hypothetical protein
MECPLLFLFQHLIEYLIMDLVTYQRNLATLIKDPAEILASLNPYKVNLWHMSSALMGELAELADASTHENHLEEFGDALFYLEGSWLAVREYPEWVNVAGSLSDLSSQAPFDINDYPWNNCVHWKSNLVISAGHLFDVVKKHVLYNKPLTLEMVQAFRLHWLAIRWLIKKHAGDVAFLGVGLYEVRQANMEKLSLRYPNLEFTDARADARADKVTCFPNTIGTHADALQYEAGESELPNVHSSQVATGADPVSIDEL